MYHTRSGCVVYVRVNITMAVIWSMSRCRVRKTTQHVTNKGVMYHNVSFVTRADEQS